MIAVRGEEVDKGCKDTAALSLERFDGRQHASNEVAAARAIGAEAGLAMNDTGSQGALGGIVGGLDVRVMDEGPERGLDGEENLFPRPRSSPDST